jgi:hypothetical protein
VIDDGALDAYWLNIGPHMNPQPTAAPQDKRRRRFVAVSILGFSLSVLWFMALAFDQMSGISVSWLFCGSFIVTGTGISAVQFMRHRSRFALFAAISFSAGILVLHYYDVTPVKPLRRLDAAVRIGMSVADVRSTARREFPEHGRFPNPVLSESVPASGIGQMLLHLESSPGFSTVVWFSDGRVSDKNSDLRPISNLAIPKIAALAAAVVGLRCWRSARRFFGGQPRTGHGIELDSVAERLQDVRRDHLRQYRTPHKVACERRSLLSSAGLAVRRVSYFRGRATDSPHDAKDERKID